VKRILFSVNAKSDVRAIEKSAAMRILTGLHRYAETGQGDVKALEGGLTGLLRLRVGEFRILFDETAGALQVHRVRNRREAYR
jgi:mRNA interferase RelE/StbE